MYHISCIADEVKIRASANMSLRVIRDVVGCNPLILGVFLYEKALLVQKVVGLRRSEATIIHDLMVVHSPLLESRKLDLIE